MSKVKKVKQVKYFVQWLVGSVADAKKVVRQFTTFGDVVASFGKGSEQYEGFEYDEGKFILKAIGDKVRVRWESNVQDFVKGYWMSPTWVDGIVTYDIDGKVISGEAYEFGNVTVKE